MTTNNIINDNINSSTNHDDAKKLFLLNDNNSRAETDDKYKLEEELSRYDEILKSYPKTKTYIKQTALIYSISKKTIEKLINARITIEYYFKDTYQENIIYGINQCFRFNKSRPFPAQVVAMITGDSIAELKHKELEKNRTEKTESEKYKEAKHKYETLRNEAIESYKRNEANSRIRQALNTDKYKLNYKAYSTPIEVLDEIMIDYISIQAHILSFGISKLNGYGIGITEHLSKISAKAEIEETRNAMKEKYAETQYTKTQYAETQKNTNRPEPQNTNKPETQSEYNSNNNNNSTGLLNNCFTMYLRSREYQQYTIRSGTINTEIPQAFIEYIKEIIIKNKMEN